MNFFQRLAAAVKVVLGKMHATYETDLASANAHILALETELARLVKKIQVQAEAAEVKAGAVESTVKAEAPVVEAEAKEVAKAVTEVKDALGNDVK